MKDEYTKEDERNDSKPRMRSCMDGMCGAEDCKLCGSEKPETEPEEIDTICQDMPTCPHCGNKEDPCDMDFSPNINDESTETDCSKCEKTYEVARNITVDYTSRKLKE